MSIYGPNIRENLRASPFWSDNGETTISYSGRIATREIRETIPLINLMGNLHINLEWKGSTNQHCFFLDREPAYCSIFAKESRVKMTFIQSRQNVTSPSTELIYSPRPMNLIQNFLLALHRSI